MKPGKQEPQKGFSGADLGGTRCSETRWLWSGIIFGEDDPPFTYLIQKRRLLGFLASRFKAFRDQRVPAFLIQFHVSHPECFPTEDLDRDDWKRASHD